MANRKMLSLNTTHINRDVPHLSAGGYYIGERGFVGISISRLESFYGIPGPEEAQIDMRQTRYGLGGELDNPMQGFHQLKFRMKYNDYKHDELEDSGEIGSSFKNDEVEGRAELLHELITNWQGVMGIKFQNSDFSASGEEAFVLSSKFHSVRLFMLEKRQWEQWQFEISGRLEHAVQNPQGNLQSRDFGLYSVSAGSAWEFFEGYQIIDLTATRRQRAPTAVALYANGLHIATQP